MPDAWPAAHSMDGDWMTGRVIGQNALFLHVLASLKDKAALALYTGIVAHSQKSRESVNPQPSRPPGRLGLRDLSLTRPTIGSWPQPSPI
jgi:hypothetical protein